MYQREEVLAAIYQALDELNATRPKNDRLEKTPATALFGADSKLDSLGLFNLVATVEEQVQSAFDVSVDISEAMAMTPATTPLRTIDTLAAYVQTRLEASR